MLNWIRPNGVKTKIKFKKKPKTLWYLYSTDIMNETGQQPSKERWDASQIPASSSLTSPNAESDLGWRVGVGLVEEGVAGWVWTWQSCDEALNCHCARLPLLLCSFLREPSGRTPALQCLPYSISAKLSLASHEKEWNFIGDQITKNGGGGEEGVQCKKKKKKKEMF